MNRNAGDNVLRDNFEQWDEQELARLKQQSPFFNNALLTAEERDDIEQAWRNKRSKPIRFKDAGDERPPESRIDEVRLCAQFDAVWQLRLSRAKDVYKQVLVRHQIESQAERRRLAEWNKRAEHLEPLLNPVHFQIYCKRAKYGMLRKGEMGQMELLQSVLVLSHFESTALLPRDLAQQVEHYLGVTLVRLILHQNLLLMLFEWEEVQHFALVLGFVVHLKSEPAKQLVQQQVVNMARPDLLAYQELDELPLTTSKSKNNNNGEVSETTELQQYSETKRALQSAFISYITAGYVKRDSSGQV